MAIVIQIELDERGTVRDIQKINRELTDLEKAGRKGGDGVDAVNSRMLKLKDVLIGGGLLMALNGLQQQILGFVKNMPAVAGSFEKLQISLETITKGHGMEWFNRLNQWAIKMPITTQEAVKGFQQLRAMGLKPTIADMEILIDTASALGGGSDTFGGIVLALGQIQTKGRLMAQEIRQLAERGIPAYEILNEKLGITGEFLEQTHHEAIDAGMAINALMEGMAERFGGQSQRMMETYVGLWEMLKGEVGETTRLFMETSGAFDAIKGSMRGTADGLDVVNERLRELEERQRAIKRLRDEGVIPGQQPGIVGLTTESAPDVFRQMGYTENQIKTMLAKMHGEDIKKQGIEQSMRSPYPTYIGEGELEVYNYIGEELERQYHFKQMILQATEENNRMSEKALEIARKEAESIWKEREQEREQWDDKYYQYTQGLADQERQRKKEIAREIKAANEEYRDQIISLADTWGTMFDYAAQRGGNFVENLRAQLVNLATSLAFRAGTAGIISSIMGGGFSLGAGTYLKHMFGFQEGGYTGSTGGYTHPHEYVSNARTVDYWGVGMFDALAKIAARGGNVTNNTTFNMSPAERAAMTNMSDYELAQRINRLKENRMIA